MSTILTDTTVVNVLDGTTQPADVLIDGNTITQISDPGSLTAPRTISLQGMYLLPGLFNVHAHFTLILPGPDMHELLNESIAERGFRALMNATNTLNAGVTSVRLCGENNHIDFALRRSIDKGYVAGPRIFTAGWALIATGGHGHGTGSTIELDGADEFRRAARAQLRAGADFIKIMLTGGIGTAGQKVDQPQLSPEEIAAVVDVTAKTGKRVAAHAGSAGAIEAALELGVSSIEHGYVLTDQTVKLMKQRDAFLVPTLTVTRGADWMRSIGCPEWMVEKTLAASVGHAESFARAARAGVRVAVGTDMMPAEPLDGTIATVREMELMVESGLDTLTALQAGTCTAADLCGAGDTLGSITPGKFADLIAVRDNPLDNISNMRGIEFVMKDGQVVRSDLQG